MPLSANLICVCVPFFEWSTAAANNAPQLLPLLTNYHIVLATDERLHLYNESAQISWRCCVGMSFPLITDVFYNSSLRMWALWLTWRREGLGVRNGVPLQIVPWRHATVHPGALDGVSISVQSDWNITSHDGDISNLIIMHIACLLIHESGKRLQQETPPNAQWLRRMDWEVSSTHQNRQSCCSYGSILPLLVSSLWLTTIFN